MSLLQHGLVVIQIHLRRAARHKQINHAFRLRSEMGLAQNSPVTTGGCWWIVRRSFMRQQISQRDGAQSESRAGKKGAAILRQNIREL